jgi:hypothetical protein
MAMRLHNVGTTWMSVVLTAAGLAAGVSVPAWLAAGVLVAAPPAFAQDAGLMDRLVELTRRKGYKDVPMGRETCERLGLRPIGDCLVFEQVYVDPYGSTHSFDTFARPGSETVRIFLFKSDPRRSYYYVAGVDGRLLRAAVFDRKRTYAWSELPIDRARPGFDQEISYWRLRQNQMEHEPNRRD